MYNMTHLFKRTITILHRMQLTGCWLYLSTGVSRQEKQTQLHYMLCLNNLICLLLKIVSCTGMKVHKVSKGLRVLKEM